MTQIVAAVEAGGTSFVVAIAEITPGSIPKVIERHEVDSSHDNPQETIAQCVAFFTERRPPSGYVALGIATFGPVGLDPTRNESYGKILSTTPKKSWRNVDILSPLVQACKTGSEHLPVKIETDVNAPAFAEYLLVKEKISSVAYITVGTGVGVGLVIDGKPVHGKMHPEGGHVSVQPLDGDTFEGYSWGGKAPFGGKRTVEGLASSVALTERLQQITGQTNTPRSRLAELSDDHEVWDHAANALANLCVTLMLTTSIEKIVLGGGIMNRQGLIDKVRRRTVTLINGYLELPSDMTDLISLSVYGPNAGLTGALLLAQHAFLESACKPPKLFTEFNVGFLHGVTVGAVVAALALRMHKP
eukprot:Nitzschia sp. Nitz4//scaffold4_size323378//209917//211082//NITZ4_000680-RA/size323378-augustus-gene-0.20-mRNA-1//1//CDS//3329553459//7958//frame0